MMKYVVMPEFKEYLHLGGLKEGEGEQQPPQLDMIVTSTKKTLSWSRKWNTLSGLSILIDLNTVSSSVSLRGCGSYNSK